jgi:DNA-binding XRE family transcriptional regulator
MSDKITQASKKLGNRIQKIRKTTNLTQEDLADKAGISRTHMGHIEQGRKTPSLKVLSQIAKSLHITISELMRV